MPAFADVISIESITEAGVGVVCLRVPSAGPARIRRCLDRDRCEADSQAAVIAADCPSVAATASRRHQPQTAS